MKNVFVMVLLVLSSFHANAESKWVQYVGTQKFVHVIYGQDSIWRMDSFSEDREGFIDLVERKSFPDEKSAMDFFYRFAQGQALTPFMDFLDQRELPTQKNFLWEVTQRWSWDWEVQYAQWIRNVAHPEFFEKYNIPVDCADAAYSFRWIFARINGLPVANHMANGQLLTQDSFREVWAKLPTDSDWTNDKRFRAALNYLLDGTYTHMLFVDSYPVEINNQTFLEGIHHLGLSDSSGHTRIVNEVNSNTTTAIPLNLIWATIPQSTAKLTEGGMWSSELPVKGQSGFLRILWPIPNGNKWKLAKPQNHPGYSEEQYDPAFLGEETSFSLAVIKRIAPNFDPKVVFNDGSQLITEGFQDRIKIVEEGFQYCQTHDCSPGTLDYENWSTPSRDARLVTLIRDLENFIQQVVVIDGSLIPQWGGVLAGTTYELFSKQYPLNMLRTIWLSTAFSSDPEDTIENRWALSADSFGKQLSKKLGELVKARTELVANNTCLSSICAVGGEEWKKWDSKNLDTLIQRLYFNSVFYCKNSDAKSCQQLQNTLRNTSISGSAASDILLRSHFYVSAPNVNADIRWAKSANLDRTQLFVNAQYIKENQLGMLAVEDKFGSRVYQGQTLLKEFLEDEHIVQIFEDKNAVVIFDSVLKIHKLWTPQQEQNLGSNLGGNFQLLTPKTFAIGSHLYLFDGKSAVGLGEYKETFLSTGNLTNANSDLVFAFEGNILKIIDVGSTSLTAEILLSGGSGPIYAMHFRDQIGTKILVEVLRENGTDFFTYDFNSQVKETFTMTNYLLGRISRGKWLSQNSTYELELLELDSDFKVQKKTTLGKIFQYRTNGQDHFLYLIDADNQQFVRHYDKFGNLQEWQLQVSQDFYPTYFSEQYVSGYQLNIGSTVLDLKDNQKVVYSSSGYLYDLGLTASLQFFVWNELEQNILMNHNHQWLKLSGDLPLLTFAYAFFDPVNGLEGISMMRNQYNPNYYAWKSNVIYMPGNNFIFFFN